MISPMDLTASKAALFELPRGNSATLSAQSLVVLSLIFLGYHAVKCLYYAYIYPFYVSPLRHLPTPKENHHWLFGQMLNLLNTPWVPYLYREWSNSCPNSPFLRILKIGNTETLIPNSITAYHEILQIKNHNFIKAPNTRSAASQVIGDALPWAHGEVHRRQRAVLNKLFSPARMKACSGRVKAKAKQLVDTVAAKKGAPGEPVTIENDIWRAVLDVAAIKTIGVDLNHLASDHSPLHDVFSATMRPNLLGHITRYFAGYMPFKEWIPLDGCSDFLRKCATARSFLGGYVREQKLVAQQGKEKAALDQDVSVLEAMADHPEMWNEDELVEYVLNFIVLGHDTTACTLLFTLDKLARRTDVQDRLRAEMMSLGENPTWSEIDRLPYLENVMREALRVYCPVAWIPMESICDVEIDGVVCPKGTTINLSPAMVNLKPEIWGPDAADFVPDRWDRLEGDAKNAYAFATFHNGPRVCPGRALAMMEIKFMIVEFLSRFRLGATHEGEMELETPSFTLKPKERLALHLNEL